MISTMPFGFGHFGAARRRAAPRPAAPRSLAEAPPSARPGRPLRECARSDANPDAGLGPTAEQAFSRNGALRCALTRAPLRDPVVAPDGFTYERRAIVAYLAFVASCSPVTGAPMHAALLGRDLALGQALARRRTLGELGVCPISLERARDPVLASDRHVYGLAELGRAYERAERSPLTRGPLDRVVYRHQLLRARSGLELAREPLAVLATRDEVERFFDDLDEHLQDQLGHLRALWARVRPESPAAAFDVADDVTCALLEISGTTREGRYLEVLEVLTRAHDELIAELGARVPSERSLLGQCCEARESLQRLRAVLEARG